MAAKLETVVSKRAGNGGGMMQLVDSSSIYQKEEKEKKLGMESTESCRAFKEFFLNLEAVLSAEDHVKSFQYLKQARHIAVELISRESDAPDGKIARLHEP